MQRSRSDLGVAARTSPWRSLRYCGLLFVLCIGLVFAWLPGVSAIPAVAGAAPLQTSTPTPLPGTGSVVGVAWNDADGDGLRGAAEGLLAAVQIRIVRSDEPSQIASGLTGSDGSVLISGLLPGTYIVSAVPPTGYAITTKAEYQMRLFAGDVLTFSFGAQFVPTPTPTATTPPVLDLTGSQRAYCNGVYTGNTSQGRAQVRTYGCKPSWDESGPEVVYRIEFDANQPVTVSLTTASADLDLFLLRYVYPDSCVAAGDWGLTHAAESGVYLLAVDGYRGATGEYALRVDCPLGVQATATPTFTPSPTPTSTFTPVVTPTVTIVPNGQRLFLPLILIES